MSESMSHGAHSLTPASRLWIAAVLNADRRIGTAGIVALMHIMAPDCRTGMPFSRQLPKENWFVCGPWNAGAGDATWTQAARPRRRSWRPSPRLRAADRLRSPRWRNARG